MLRISHAKNVWLIATNAAVIQHVISAALDFIKMRHKSVLHAPICSVTVYSAVIKNVKNAKIQAFILQLQENVNCATLLIIIVHSAAQILTAFLASPIFTSQAEYANYAACLVRGARPAKLKMP